jgi:NitT/TauT family transport system ATP-binding protein
LILGLELKALAKTFPAQGNGGEVEVLTGLDLALEHGRFLSVVGPSGCGKTTLLRIIAGLEPASQGEVLLDGKPVRSASPDMGLVFQQYALFPWRTTLQNIEVGLQFKGVDPVQRRKEAMEYMEAFGLTGFEDRYPKDLSGGMQQRVAIARTLIMQPKLVLMDEPFGSLDSQTRNNMQEFLLGIWEKRHDTIIFVTHNVDEAVFLSEEVMVLSSRPARPLASFPIDAPWPRDRTSAECNQMRKIILDVLRSEQPLDAA